MGKALKLLFIFVISIPYAVVVSGSFYKLLTHNKSTYKVIKGHSSIQFFQSQCRTVMSLNDYIRDRMNNNLGMHELMKYEWARFESFELYPDEAPLFPLKLARAGFYFTGENQTVKCFCCGEQFDADDYEELNEAHQRNSRNCSFVRGEASANIPIKHFGRSDDVNFGSRDNQDVTQCRYPNYITEESRRQTFRWWPHRNKRQMQEMVDAGLFYTDERDYVRCYSCGIGIGGWSDAGDPWVEHARCSPECQHVRQHIPECIRPSLNELNTGHKQETRSSEQTSCEMRTRLAQRLLQMGYNEERISDALNYFRTAGRNELDVNHVLDYIKTTDHLETIIYDPLSRKFSPVKSTNVPTLCSEKNAANKSLDQSESSQIESAQESKIQTDIGLCKVCTDKPLQIVFLPCGHLETCEDCAPKLQKCTVCRAVIKNTVRTYM